MEVRYFATTSGWKGAVELYGEKDTVTLPAQEETWTPTSERNGKVKAARQVSVDRGQTVDVGDACKRR